MAELCALSKATTRPIQNTAWAKNKQDPGKKHIADVWHRCTKMRPLGRCIMITHAALKTLS
eukprot:3222631-Pleurochrysis_carterae.AAC.1